MSTCVCRCVGELGLKTKKHLLRRSPKKTRKVFISAQTTDQYVGEKINHQSIIDLGRVNSEQTEEGGVCVRVRKKL